MLSHSVLSDSSWVRAKSLSPVWVFLGACWVTQSCLTLSGCVLSHSVLSESSWVGAGSLSHVWLFFESPWTVAHQAPLFMGFSRQEYWSGVPFPSPRHLPDPGIKLVSLVSPSLAGRFFTTSSTWLDLEAKLSKIKGKPVYNILGSGFLGILGRKGNPDFWTPFLICRVDPH